MDNDDLRGLSPKVRAWIESDTPWRMNIMGGHSHRVESRPAPVSPARVRGYVTEAGGTREAAREAVRAADRAELAAEAEAALADMRPDMREATKACLGLILRIGTGRYRDDATRTGGRT